MKGPIMEVNHPENWHFVDVWNHRTIPVQRQHGKSLLSFPQETPDVISCIIGMPKILNIQVVDDSLYITTTKKVENDIIRINNINCLTLMEEEKLSLSNDQHNVALVVKLMQDNILKDEVVLNLK